LVLFFKKEHPCLPGIAAKPKGVMTALSNPFGLIITPPAKICCGTGNAYLLDWQTPPAQMKEQ
jgi:hypothetical protein